MMLSEETMYSIINHLADAGVAMGNIVKVAEDGAMVLKDGLPQLQPYGQITLVKAAQELGVALPEGWIHMDFSFLGMDLTMIPSDVIGQIGTGGWAVIGVLLIPIVSGALSFWQSKVSMAGNPSAADPNDPTARSSRMMMWKLNAPHGPLDRLYPARLPRRVLDREQRSDARAGEGAQQVFQEEHGCGGRGT